MYTETISNSTCVVLVLSFLHKGDPKYTGSCDLNQGMYKMRECGNAGATRVKCGKYCR